MTSLCWLPAVALAVASTACSLHAEPKTAMSPRALPGVAPSGAHPSEAPLSPAQETPTEPAPAAREEPAPDDAPTALAEGAERIVADAPATVATTIYAALFQTNRTWTFRESYAGSYWSDGKEERSTGESDVTCRVLAVKETAGQTHSAITCDDEAGTAGAFPLRGYWVATSAGLFQIDRDELAYDTHAELTDADLGKDPVMPRSPAPRRKREVDGDFHATTSVRKSGGAWCWRTEGLVGDAYWRSLCFASGDGVVSGTYGFAGGSVHDLSFVLQRQPVRAPSRRQPT